MQRTLRRLRSFPDLLYSVICHIMSNVNIQEEMERQVEVSVTITSRIDAIFPSFSEFSIFFSIKIHFTFLSSKSILLHLRVFLYH